MEKTVTANIGGQVFHIEDKAYEKLKSYLERIKGYFSDSEGRDEIMGDIETRLAELFQERLANQKEVVQMADVDAVILVMGQPEDFASEGSIGDETDNSSDYTYQRKRRRVFRNPDNRVLGGVCGGIGSYFGIDPLWIRIAFLILLFFGPGILVYIILWIIIPEAKTAAEKLEMEGEPVNATNIGRKIEEEMDRLKKKFGDFSDNAGTFQHERVESKLGSAIHKAGNFIAQLLIMLAKGIFRIIGFVFAAASVIALGILLIVVFSPNTTLIIPGKEGITFSFMEALGILVGGPVQVSLTIIGLTLLIGIPLVLLLMLGLKLLLNIKGSVRIPAYIPVLAWIAGLVIFGIITVRTVMNFNVESDLEETVTLNAAAGDTLIVKVDDADFYNDTARMYYMFDHAVYLDEEHEMLYFRDVELDIDKAPGDDFQLKIIRSSRGSSTNEARMKASKVNYSYTTQDSILSLSKFISYPKHDLWRDQEVQCILLVPEGKTVLLSQNTREIIYDIDNVQDIWDSDMIGKYWKMTSNGLSCVNCSGNERTIRSNNHNKKINIDVSIETYSGAQGCKAPMKKEKFREIESLLNTRNSDETKLIISKQATSGECLTSNQVNEIMEEFDFDQYKLEFAKFAWPRTFDQDNYYMVNSTFKFESSVHELDEFIKQHKSDQQ